jgi:phasin family protein
MTSPANDANDFTQTVMKACEDVNSMMTSYVSAAAKSNAATLQGIEDMTRNMSSFMQESIARSVSACKAMMTAKSPQEAADTHSEFLKDCFDGMVAGGSKMSEISLRVAKGAIDPLAQHTNEAVGAVMKKARVAA